MFIPKVEKLALRIVNLKGGGIVDYSKPTRTRRVELPFKGGKVFVNSLLSKGNAKLDRGVLIFDTLAVYTCPHCKECKEYCYARKNQVRFPAVWNRRLINTWLAVHDIPALELQLTKELSRSRKKIVRIHSSGDFFSQEYLNMWGRLSSIFPEKTFYTYTKVLNNKMLDFSGILMSENVNIVDSMLSEKTPNFGDLNFVKWAEKTFGAKVCPCGFELEGSKKVVCGKDCTICHTETKVVFLKH